MSAPEPGEPRTVRVGPASIRVDDGKPTFWDRVEAGAWEPALLALLGRVLGPGWMFLDLGAWVGPLSLLAAHLGARVVAVEADPVAAALFRRNLAANPVLASRVTLLERAVAPKPGRVRLGARRKPGDSMSSILLGDGAGSWDAEAVTPVELAALAAGAPLLVKLDLEGAEYRLLPALGPLVAVADVVAVALHPDILREAGEPDPDRLAREGLAAFAGWTVLGEGPCDTVAAVRSPLPRDWVLIRPGGAADQLGVAQPTGRARASHPGSPRQA